MTPNTTRNFAGPAAQFLLGAVALTLVTLAFFRLHADLPTAAFANLIVILLFSLIGSLTVAVLLCLWSVAILAYVIAHPPMSFAIDDPQHVVVLAAFCVTAVTVACLIGNARKERQAAFEAEAKLRRSQVELRDSEREWREVFEHNPVMYFMVDADGIVLNVNSFGAAQLGYTVADLVGKSVLNVFVEEDRAFVRKCVAVCLEAVGQSHTWEIQKTRKDGSRLWVRENAKAMRRADDKLIVLVACEDITERRRTEDALQISEAYLADAQELSHTGSWSWDVRRRDFIYRSAEVYRLFGFDPEQGASADDIQSRIPPEDLQALGELVQQAVQGKQGHFEFDFRISLPDGATRRIHSVAHAVLGTDGAVSEIVGTHMDVTEQHAARERLETAVLALHESEQRFRDYAETASDWLWETGPDHRVTHLSEHARAAGISASVVPGLPRWEVASDVESEPEKWRQHRATLEAHLPFRDLVYRSENRAGSPIYVRTSGKPVFDADETFLGYRGVSTDITASIRADQAEQALRKAQAELAHVTRVTTLGELTASIAHEINQPLAAVITNAEACLSWLGRTPPDLDAARRSVEWIVEDSNRASEVIQRVRALAKKTDIEKAPLDINDVAGDAVALVQRELLSQDVSLMLKFTPDLPPIFGDRVQLQQVIINLVINAVEAMQSIEGRPRELTIRSGRQDTDKVFLAVADNGSGIPDSDAERVFTPFFTTKSSGMGMGLSICRSIVEAHEGRLTASRNERGGATFQFVLPVHEEDTP
jgi:PAS domain S-box-containing protein